jgi:hypothetical protein
MGCFEFENNMADYGLPGMCEWIQPYLLKRLGARKKKIRQSTFPPPQPPRPLGAQAYVAVETAEVIRTHGLKGVYGLLLYIRETLHGLVDFVGASCF